MKEEVAIRNNKGYYIVADKFNSIKPDNKPHGREEVWILETHNDRVSLQNANTGMYLGVNPQNSSLIMVNSVDEHSLFGRSKDSTTGGTYFRSAVGMYLAIGRFISGVQLVKGVKPKACFDVKILKTIKDDIPTDKPLENSPPSKNQSHQPAPNIYTQPSPASVAQSPPQPSPVIPPTNTFNSQNPAPTPIYGQYQASNSTETTTNITPYQFTPSNSLYSSSNSTQPTSNAFDRTDSGSMLYSFKSLPSSNVPVTVSRENSNSSTSYNNSSDGITQPVNPVSGPSGTISNSPKPKGARYTVPTSDCGVPEFKPE